MDRLTNHQEILHECIGCTEESNCYEFSCGKIEEAIQKLARYEDTMLTPEEIIEIKERIEYYDRLENALYKVFGGGEKLVEVAVRTLLNDPCYDDRIMIPDLDSWVKMYGDKSLLDDGK